MDELKKEVSLFLNGKQVGKCDRSDIVEKLEELEGRIAKLETLTK